jgi:hypothetical protein
MNAASTPSPNGVIEVLKIGIFRMAAFASVAVLVAVRFRISCNSVQQRKSKCLDLGA